MLNCAVEHLHLMKKNTFKVPQLVRGTHKTAQIKFFLYKIHVHLY